MGLSSSIRRASICKLVIAPSSIIDDLELCFMFSHPSKALSEAARTVCRRALARGTVKALTRETKASITMTDRIVIFVEISCSDVVSQLRSKTFEFSRRLRSHSLYMGELLKKNGGALSYTVTFGAIHHSCFKITWANCQNTPLFTQYEQNFDRRTLPCTCCRAPARHHR